MVRVYVYYVMKFWEVGKLPFFGIDHLCAGTLLYLYAFVFNQKVNSMADRRTAYRKHFSKLIFCGKIGTYGINVIIYIGF